MIYSVPEHGGTNPKFAAAFAKGSGLPITESRDWLGGLWAGFGSPHNWESLRSARKAGADWVYGDHGYFGRGEYFRVTRGAFQWLDGWSHLQRREPGVAVQPWRTNGRHVLVCPPDDLITRLVGFDENVWLDDVLTRLRNNTDRPIKVRRRDAVTTLDGDLQDAWTLVTWTSNAAVDALLAGVPVFCTGDCAASVMGRSDPINIEYPYYPDNRYEWAATLAANQWTLDEIASGMAWEVLNVSGSSPNDTEGKADG